MNSRRRLAIGQPGFVVPGALLLLFAVWYVIAAIVHDPLFLPGPVEVAISFVRLLTSGQLAAAAVQSALTFITGLLLALAIGLPLGIMMALHPLTGKVGGLYVIIFWATPSIALLPLIIKWFGLTMTTKLVIVLLSAIFPIIINTRAGIEQVDESYREVARGFGATRWEMIRYILVPGSVPYIVAGLQIAVGRAVIGVVVAELFTSVSGLGALMSEYANFFQMAGYFAALIMFILFSLAVTGLVNWLAAHAVQGRME